MDNLFSFPSGAFSTPRSSAADTTDPPVQDLSNREIPISNGSEMTEEIENVRELSDATSFTSDRLHVRLKLLDERVFDVHVDPSLDVAAFRATVERVTSIPVPLQRLIYRGKLLKDGALLSNYDIQDGHTIHLVSKPVGSPRAAVSATPLTASTDQQQFQDDEQERLNRFIGRSRERLRQTMDEEERVRSGQFDLNIPRPSLPSMGTSRVRRPGVGDPTGDAWNLAVLREALGQHSDRIPARSSNRDSPSLDILRQGNEQRQMAENDSPVDTAAAMGFNPVTSTEEQPNLDYLSQGIMTLRTVLSTAALPQDTVETADEATQTEEPATVDEDEQTTQQHPTVSPGVSPRRGRRRFFVGQWLDVKDTVNQWLECTVMDMTEDKVLVHYHGWPSRWDEWLDFDSSRIAAFRTRTQHTQNSIHLSPAPSTRLPNAPAVGENNMRQIIPQIRDLMEEVLPYVDQLVTLCEDAGEGESDDFDETRTRRREELSEVAHLVAPFFDRFGRLLVDSARQLDPLLHPDLRHEERRRRLLRARGSAPSRQTTQAPTVPVEDSALGIRDLITPATRTPQEQQNPRRSIDVHIHAIVAPSSLSSLASLARLGTAIAGAMGSSSRSNSSPQETQRPSNELEDAFGLPPIRPLQGGSDDRSIVADVSDPDGDDARYTDTSRTPLLSSFRRDQARSRDRDNNQRAETNYLRPRRQGRSSSSRLHDFLSDDFFGPSFSQDSDDMDDPVSNVDSFGTVDRSHDDVVQYQEMPSPRESEDEQHTLEIGTPRLGVIPEIEEAERRERERREHVEASELEDGSRSSSASSNSSGYPTFLEVMRRTLSGVRNFGFSSSSSSVPSEETSPATSLDASTTQRTTRSESDSSSTSSPGSVVDINFPDDMAHLAEPRPVFQRSPMLAVHRLRQLSSDSSIEEDLDSVD